MSSFRRRIICNSRNQISLIILWGVNLYIENIRKAINTLSINQFGDLPLKLRKKLKYKFNTDTKPSC